MKDKNIFKDQKNRETIQSPIRLLTVIILSIIVTEILVEIFIKVLPSMGEWSELLINSILLSIIFLPVLYFFAFRPLTINIAERKLAHEEILKLHAAVESSGEAIFITDIDGLITYINPEFTNLYGYTADEVIGKTTPRILKSGVMTPESYKYFWDTLLNKEMVRSEHINKTKDGRLITIEGSANPILNDQKEIIRFVAIQHDITKRKQTEEKLRESEEKFRLMVTNIRDVVYKVDVESKEFKYLSPSFERITGYSLEDIKNLGGRKAFLTKVVTEAKYTEWDNFLLQLNEGQLNEGQLHTDFKHETWWLCKDGSYKCLHDHWIPIYVNGKLVSTDGMLIDITDRKLAEEAQRQSEERFRSVTQLANDAIITTDNKGNILGWNKGAEITFGYTESEIIGQSLNFIIPGDYQELHIKGMKRLETGGEKHVIGKTVELHGLKKDGNSFPLELSLSEWETSEGKFFTGIIRDITTRKRTELLNQVIYEITQGITTTSNLDELLKLIHHSIGKVVYAENCFVALHDQVTGLFSFPYFVDKVDPTPMPTSMGKSCTAYVFRTVKPLLWTQKIFDRLKEQNEVELVGSPSPSWIGIPLQTPSRTIGVLVLQHYEKENVFSENDEKFLVSIGSQIALSIERKKAEEEIKLKNELLQALNAEKDKFFSILAHDLRGPLSAFVAATQILTEEIQTMDMEEIKDITGSMKTSATNIYSLLENLLEWSRLRRGAMEFVPEKLHLKEKIEACIDVLSESARKKSIELTFSIPGEIEVFADNHMFDTVIRNLVSNAIKFTHPVGKINVTAGYNSEHSVEVKISDTGIGMTPELKNKLFMLSEKTSRQGTEGETSTGLGLLLCKEFIEKHGGKISVESEVGKGSTFSFTMGQSENLKMR